MLKNITELGPKEAQFISLFATKNHRFFLLEEAVQYFLHSVNIAMQDAIGIRTDEREMVIDVIEDDYGKESFEARIYYYGPWNYGGSPRSVRIHTNREESLVFPTNVLPVFYQYSDRKELPAVAIQVSREGKRESLLILI